MLTDQKWSFVINFLLTTEQSKENNTNYLKPNQQEYNLDLMKPEFRIIQIKSKHNTYSLDLPKF